MAELQRQGRATNLFINLTPSAFKDADLMTLLINGLKEMKIKPESVVLEADEDAIIAHYADAKTFIQSAKKLGCRFTVDNFGTNLATLNQIRDLPVQFLKISGAIVRNLSTDRVSQASLKAVIELAQALNKQTIAKSVEKAEDMSILFNLGVDYVQGHYFQEADSQMNYEFGAGGTILGLDHVVSTSNRHLVSRIFHVRTVYLHHAPRLQGGAAEPRHPQDISLSFFPGAKIGVLGLNGSGKSHAAAHHGRRGCQFRRRARPQPGIQIGFLPQEPQLDPTKTCAATSRRRWPKPRRCSMRSTRSRKSSPSRCRTTR